ncbi:hypothetical protein Sjap_016526 [Stephania japonica]|uniref:Uncharacterized protein n=1 Tax=Stephania japonica TaxID=461633 RepID=A0AAP0NTJ3_9MAGN
MSWWWRRGELGGVQVRGGEAEVVEREELGGTEGGLALDKRSKRSSDRLEARRCEPECQKSKLTGVLGWMSCSQTAHGVWSRGFRAHAVRAPPRVRIPKMPPTTCETLSPIFTSWRRCQEEISHGVPVA